MQCPHLKKESVSLSLSPFNLLLVTTKFEKCYLRFSSVAVELFPWKWQSQVQHPKFSPEGGGRPIFEAHSNSNSPPFFCLLSCFLQLIDKTRVLCPPINQPSAVSLKKNLALNRFQNFKLKLVHKCFCLWGEWPLITAYHCVCVCVCEQNQPAQTASLLFSLVVPPDTGSYSVPDVIVLWDRGVFVWARGRRAGALSLFPQSLFLSSPSVSVFHALILQISSCLCLRVLLNIKHMKS